MVLVLKLRKTQPSRGMNPSILATRVSLDWREFAGLGCQRSVERGSRLEA